MKYKKTIVLLGIIVILFLIFKKDLWEKNEDILQEEVVSIQQSVETINLKEVTPFEWDKVYSFSPYTPKDTIYETVGYKWDRIQETVNEGMNQIVFLKDGKVVCYVYGYPSNVGYGISLSGETLSEYATVLYVEDDLTFKVEREKEVVYLIKEF
ncbi:hypothetical protein [Fredinandcohnia onubensis]|uniref:hypothetical protein n=1 Tax=Fredinandcohnia onubensis TaxID=1571209 RepID=UPI000C0C0994|nr:hypothetical protein [Fredinandcohnia onubensis]